MIKNIIFDFDGVILDSMHTRSEGFRKIFKEYDKNKVEELISYHLDNGGLSRFIKIRYFFEKLLFKEIREEEILSFANKYSEIMRKELLNEKYLIKETVSFIKKNNSKTKMFIASGSEEKELRFINEFFKLDSYFLGIFGSPRNKIDIVKLIIENNKLNISETVLVGDSINDYDAAKKNNIRFFGYNSIELEKISDKYINTFLEGI